MPCAPQALGDCEHVRTGTAPKVRDRHAGLNPERADISARMRELSYRRSSVRVHVLHSNNYTA
jgi:hypothetical protein